VAAADPQRRQLDLTDGGSVTELAAWLQHTFPGGIDILLNNAGMAFKVRHPEVVWVG
jgi:NAD(P)-dependent dehydrogenase (short-subunit alcohol dehydrogenase family)